MLNFTGGRQARLHYLSGSYRVIGGGDHVICAVSGMRVPLTALRYWSSELQEAYSTAEIAVKRHAEARGKGLL